MSKIQLAPYRWLARCNDSLDWWRRAPLPLRRYACASYLFFSGDIMSPTYFLEFWLGKKRKKEEEREREKERKKKKEKERERVYM